MHAARNGTMAVRRKNCQEDLRDKERVCVRMILYIYFRKFKAKNFEIFEWLIWVKKVDRLRKRMF